MRSFSSFSRAFGRAVARLLRRLDGRDLLIVLALGCITAGVWMYAPGAALIVLGALLLIGWCAPVIAARPQRRG